MLSKYPNILYIHSHDTGRYVQPYGYAMPTPRIQRLAEEGVLFRKAFCAAPTCSASRACLLTGQYAHSNGMLGLAHRGFSLRDYSHHLVHILREVGYYSALVGEQHISKEPGMIGYDRVFKIETSHVDFVAPIAIDILRKAPSQPFFLSVGFFETHREFSEPASPADINYIMPPPTLPDTVQTRRDMAAFKASVESLDRGIGAVLDALEANGFADNTLVICTTDHGLAFPGMKSTLTDHGIGVMLIMRGPGGFSGGKVCDAMVSHIDLFPTICELMQYGWKDRPVAQEQLYDLIFDPNETCNQVDNPALASVLAEMRSRLADWMSNTDDPLLHGPVQVPPGTELNDPDQLSTNEATHIVS